MLRFCDVKAGDWILCTKTTTFGKYSFQEGKIYQVSVLYGDSEENISLRDIDSGNHTGYFNLPSDSFIKQENITKQSGGLKMLKTLKDYFEKNKDMILTITIIILLDNYLFGGALREKIKASIEKMLGKIDTKLEA
jgi:hypothetical protein